MNNINLIRVEFSHSNKLIIISIIKQSYIYCMHKCINQMAFSNPLTEVQINVKDIRQGVKEWKANRNVQSPRHRNFFKSNIKLWTLVHILKTLFVIFTLALQNSHNWFQSDHSPSSPHDYTIMWRSKRQRKRAPVFRVSNTKTHESHLHITELHKKFCICAVCSFLPEQTFLQKGRCKKTAPYSTWCKNWLKIQSNNQS